MVNEETKNHYLSITPSPALRDKICQSPPSEATRTKKRAPISRILGFSTCAAALLVLLILNGLRVPDILLLANGATIGNDAVLVSQEAAMARMTLPGETGETLIIPLSLQGSRDATLHVSSGVIQPNDTPQTYEISPEQKAAEQQDFIWVLEDLQPDALPTLTVQLGRTQHVYSLYHDQETGVWYIKQDSTP